LFGKYDKRSNGVTPIGASIMLLLDFVALASGEMRRENLRRKRNEKEKEKGKNRKNARSWQHLTITIQSLQR
jgi:hypothetical protein